MKKIITTSHFAFLAFATVIPLMGCANTGAIIKMCVVDEAGKPIDGVRSDIYDMFDMDSKPGLTDSNGFYSSHLQNLNELSGHFEKFGYYKTSGVFWRASARERVPPVGTNFTVVLKRIIEPLSLKHKEINLTLPRMDESVGFDLEMGDWVFPDGKGQVTDVFLTSNGYYTSADEYSFHVVAEFPNKHDGIQSFHIHQKDAKEFLRSDLLAPSSAPESGYTNTFERFTKLIPPDKRGASSYDGLCRWIYRIRTVVDENDNIVSANYGWMTKDMIFAPNFGRGKISFAYYYNPGPHSRSLEPKEIADRQARELPKEYK